MLAVSLLHSLGHRDLLLFLVPFLLLLADTLCAQADFEYQYIFCCRSTQADQNQGSGVTLSEAIKVTTSFIL